MDLGGLPAIVDGDRDAEGPGILLTHGAGGDKSGEGLQALAQGLAENGHLVVRFDLPYRAAGRKTPPKAESSVGGFVEALAAAEGEFGIKDWVVGGKSYGGRVASLAVADGMGASGLLFYGYPLHAPGKKASPRIEHWPAIKAPSIFLQGTNDALCDVDILKTHLGDLGAVHRLVLVQGGDHSLKVAAKRSADGKAASPSKVLGELAAEISAWLAKL